MSGEKPLPAGWQWPWQYDFPPFFTLQPNSDTRAKQLEAWVELVLAYFKATRSYLLDVNEAGSSPLFSNKEKKRERIERLCLGMSWFLSSETETASHQPRPLLLPLRGRGLRPDLLVNPTPYNSIYYDVILPYHLVVSTE